MRDAGGTDGEEGGGQVFMVVEEKRRGSAARAFPDRAAAKPGGSNRTTEITNNVFKNNFTYLKEIYKLVVLLKLNYIYL
jgi:hypothetical protein